MTLPISPLGPAEIAPAIQPATAAAQPGKFQQILEGAIQAVTRPQADAKQAVEGFLSDHYNPANKTVNLSPDVYNGNSISSAAVAAHECGHAVQHATAYRWLALRSKLVPAVQVSSGLVQWVLFLGVIMIKSFPQLLLGGIILFAVTTLFSLITLPVEIDASRRALVWLNHTNVTNPMEYPKAKNALKWAATTYVVAALASVVILIQYILIYAGGRRN